MLRVTPLFLLLAISCGRSYPVIGTVSPPSLTLDAGRIEPDAGPTGCNVPFGGPNCCDSAGTHVGGATCTADRYTCTTGTVCACAGEPQAFYCSDVCGSDAYINPTCGAAGWFCPSGLIKTTDCEPGTCWGEPGDACQTRCVDGRWSCVDTDGGTDDPPNDTPSP
ncbi:MAG: hypothetical protein IPJ65_41930 [Archangiaceae bacterium]|nr:hypothetical protein [Archangiaceae bacterium]